MNWDVGSTEDNLAWILKQNECDAGTALHVLQFSFLQDDHEAPAQFMGLGPFILKKAAQGGFAKNKCLSKRSNGLFSKNLTLPSDAPSEFAVGLRNLFDKRPQKTLYDVPCSADECGVSLIGSSQDYSGERERDIELPKKIPANPASALVFG